MDVLRIERKKGVKRRKVQREEEPDPEDIRLVQRYTVSLDTVATVPFQWLIVGGPLPRALSVPGLEGLR